MSDSPAPTVDVLEEAARAAAAGEPAALATVVRTAGSTPRHAGAKMVVRADGSITGSIGGGRIEHEVVEVAVAVARGERPATRVQRHLGHDLAMCCGGRMDVWIEPLDGSRAPALAEAVRRRRARTPCALATWLEPPGDKRVLDDDDAVAARRPRLDGRVLVEPLLPTPRVVLFGAGHVAFAIAPLAAGVGFEVAVCDDDERYASPARFPGARRVASFDVREVEAELGPLGRADHVVILTRDHAVDQEVLARLLGRPLAYLGLIGSRGKIGRFRRRLEARGLDDPHAWALVRSPIGLDIGAETPEEIALAVVAELVRERHRTAPPVA